MIKVSKEEGFFTISVGGRVIASWPHKEATQYMFYRSLYVLKLWLEGSELEVRIA